LLLTLSAVLATASTLRADTSLTAYGTYWEGDDTGKGGGYYYTSSDLPGNDNTSGYFGQIGVEATLVWFGAMAEIRFHDLEGSYFDGRSINVGLLVKW